MGLLDSFRKSLGLTHKTILTEEQTALFEQLLKNRRAASESVVPSDMRDEFVRRTFADDHLKKLVVDAYNEQLIPAERRRLYTEDCLRISLSLGRFGRRLLMRGIDPEKVFAVMFTGIQFPVRNDSKTERTGD
jgi:hypothetical protein